MILIVGIFFSAAWTNQIAEKTKIESSVAGNPLLKKVDLPNNQQLLFQETGSTTSCVENIGPCTSLGAGWNQEGPQQDTIDAIFCAMSEQDKTEWDAWIQQYYPFITNANYPSATWGLERSFSTDADLPYLSFQPNPQPTSNMLGIFAGGSLNPGVFKSILSNNPIGACNAGVVSDRYTCCRDFGSAPDHVCREVLGSPATNPNICASKLGTNRPWTFVSTWLTVDGMYCRIDDVTIQSWWAWVSDNGTGGKFNQELLGADWGMGIGSTSTDVDKGHISGGAIPKLTQESTVLSVNTAIGLGLSPALFKTGFSPPYNYFGSCPRVIVSQRSLCCT